MLNNIAYSTEKSSILETLYYLLPHKPYCSNNLDYGLKIKSKEKAIDYKYIQINDLYIKSLIIDIDRPEAATMWLDYGSVTPNWISINEENGHGHYCWILDKPIPLTHNARQKPIEYFKTIRYSLSKQYESDLAYSGLITKNPLKWQTTFLTNKRYTLNELTSGIDLESPPPRLESGVGRNVSLFDSVRVWAYTNIRQHHNYDTWVKFIYNVTNSLNTFEPSLPTSEVKSISRSVANWVWKNFTKEKFSEIQSIRGKRSAIARTAKNKDKIITTKELYKQGKTYREIAKELGISLRTIHNWLNTKYTLL